MRLIGCDLHARQQSIAMLDGDTGEIVEKTLTHEGGTVREFYASIPAPVVVGILPIAKQIVDALEAAHDQARVSVRDETAQEGICLC